MITTLLSLKGRRISWLTTTTLPSTNSPVILVDVDYQFEQLMSELRLIATAFGRTF
jgi:hypothetical protein